MLWIWPIVTSPPKGIRTLLIGFLKHRKLLKGSYHALSCMEEECVGVQALCALRKLLSLCKSPGWLSPTFEPAVVGSEWIQYPRRDQLTTRFVIIAVVCKIAFGVDFLPSQQPNPRLMPVVICQRQVLSSEGSWVEPKPATLQINSFFSCLSPCQDPLGLFFFCFVLFYPMQRNGRRQDLLSFLALLNVPACLSSSVFFFLWIWPFVFAKKGKSCLHLTSSHTSSAITMFAALSREVSELVCLTFKKAKKKKGVSPSIFKMSQDVEMLSAGWIWCGDEEDVESHQRDSWRL